MICSELFWRSRIERLFQQTPEHMFRRIYSVPLLARSRRFLLNVFIFLVFFGSSSLVEKKNVLRPFGLFFVLSFTQVGNLIFVSSTKKTINNVSNAVAISCSWRFREHGSSRKFFLLNISFFSRSIERLGASIS